MSMLKAELNNREEHEINNLLIFGVFKKHTRERERERERPY